MNGTKRSLRVLALLSGLSAPAPAAESLWCDSLLAESPGSQEPTWHLGWGLSFPLCRPEFHSSWRPFGLPSTLDRPDLGAGDLHALSHMRRIPLHILVVEEPASRHFTRRYFRTFVAALDRRLDYLSGGDFSLKLKDVEWIHPQAGVLPDREACRGAAREKADQTKGGAFVMIVTSRVNGGAYFGKGVFEMEPNELDVRPYNRKVIHEILHALISPAHSRSAESTLRQYNFVIGLAREEARFLGWPANPPVSPDASLFN